MKSVELEHPKHELAGRGLVGNYKSVEALRVKLAWAERRGHSSCAAMSFFAYKVFAHRTR